MHPLRTRTVRAGLAALTIAAIAAAPAGAPGADTTARDIDLDQLYLDATGLGRVVVAYDDDVDTAALMPELAELGVVRGIELRSIGAVAVTATPDVLLDVLTDDRVADFHQQRRLVLDLYASRTQINAEEADQPAPYAATVDGVTFDTERPGVTGEGVVVGIIDSGIASEHPDLVNTIAGYNFSFAAGVDMAGATAEQWDAYATETGSAALQDDIGHGTHVASTVGGTGQLAADTGGPDLSGVAPAAQFISLKITTAPAGIVEDFDFEESALAAIDFVIRHPELGIKVTNNSWGLLPTEPNCLGEFDGCFGLGEETDFDAVRDAVDAMVDSGVHTVFSSGNDGPADEDGVGTIGAHNGTKSIIVGAACKLVDSGCAEGEDITGFSSRGNTDGSGPQVDVAAPGDQIMAALSPASVLAPLTECPDRQHPGYFCISGTSMASPHVAGVAALMVEVNPDITTAELKACIKDTAVAMPNALGLTEAQVRQDAGDGLVDTEAALMCAHDPAPPAPAGHADPAPAPDAEAGGEDLAATGGGTALLAVLALAGALAISTRRRLTA